ncbi:hypothetical protein [Sodalis-like endosymbiont of Proechinophthirus fluctus]|uniref:hypothetical protein n=1 Tax=Sodalis-like endosymbiont of Proechinophthirus fluctus TaxID=1462730 RepID=UPI00082B4ED6|nr:hypothetical protein [Sodalis-like endosymbiont of Proechinophthirus fluctus]
MNTDTLHELFDDSNQVLNSRLTRMKKAVETTVLASCTYGRSRIADVFAPGTGDVSRGKDGIRYPKSIKLGVNVIALFFSVRCDLKAEGQTAGEKAAAVAQNRYPRITMRPQPYGGEIPRDDT